ncbi:MAG: hypothetical protein Q9226_001321 [Calogaya cf. arnoldii]
MSSTPVEVIKTLLANTSDLSVPHSHRPNATYVSLNYNNRFLQKILPCAGSHPNEGPLAIFKTFATVNKIWSQEHSEISSLFGEGETAAVFDRFTYWFRTLGKESTSPFSIWAKVVEGKVVYLQFMEDTLDTTSTFNSSALGRTSNAYFKENVNKSRQLNNKVHSIFDIFVVYVYTDPHRRLYQS